MKTTKEKIQDASAPFAIALLFSVFLGIAIHSHSSWISIAICFIVIFSFCILTIVAYNAPNPPSLLERFLIENNLLEEFILELKKQNILLDINDFFRNHGNQYSSLHFLSWKKTERGDAFWRYKEKKYHEFINKILSDYDEE